MRRGEGLERHQATGIRISLCPILLVAPVTSTVSLFAMLIVPFPGGGASRPAPFSWNWRPLPDYLTVLGAESSELLAMVLLEALEVTVAVMVCPLATLLRGWKAKAALPEPSVVTLWPPR